MYKAAIPLASGLAFVPAGATEPIVLHPSKGTEGGRPFVDYYNLRVVQEPNTLDYVPEPEWLARTGRIAPPGTLVVFVRRPEHPLGKKYPYRAVATPRPGGGTSIRLFVDETETKDSVKWLLLHELAHALVTAQPTLAETLRAEPRPPGYPHNDAAHEAVFEERLANAFADRLAPVPGLDRRWWRARTKTLGYSGAGTGASSSVLPLVVLVGILGYALATTGR
jgi:hypothetical protein